ncbi:2-keto-4-pentenoate hydratase [Phenylobacterium deserti]|uniref:2-keto-4-pentenoate hydratase n=1 Tax=Phenylobacterium deserti TaxID=1914756 RepID=A0A328AVE5_9CAUL|nr:2-keto-4-pentenoate hydratase [Phenylobacterium deserti]RAK56898.1 2-keto-4-pentenoate hydratase [Phenylobacterium deserti]
MTFQAAASSPSPDPTSVARAFVQARRTAVALDAFPGGQIPADLAAGYACQDVAIGLWGEEIAGWKVGRIPDDLQAELGAERVAGPIFPGRVWRAGDGPVILPVIPGGFAAVEAEYVFRIGEDAPAGKTDWTVEEALMLVEDELVGVELAGSPLATINVLGPKVVASDFGNNAGLVLGASIPNWRERNDDWPPCETFIDGISVGRGAPSSIPGSPAAALVFLLGVCAARGRPLKRGQLVSTGAATGIHDIEAGQTARITFEGLGEIRCIAQIAQPEEGLGGNKDEFSHPRQS